MKFKIKYFYLLLVISIMAFVSSCGQKLNQKNNTQSREVNVSDTSDVNGNLILRDSISIIKPNINKGSHSSHAAHSSHRSHYSSR